MNIKHIEEAVAASKLNGIHNWEDGGPFGAVIVKDGKAIAYACNSVLASKDPTAHAEVNCIRKACSVLGTHDLTGCELYTSCYPCPMCLSAIIWSNIKQVYYCNTKQDAADIGFRDDMIYETIGDINLAGDQLQGDTISLNKVEYEDAIKVFEDFKNNEKKEMY